MHTQQVWQDLSSWNVEFSSVYPQFSLKCINRLEHVYLGQVKWDLYISASLYAKYYFALRSLAEGRDFRRRYNYVMQVQRLPNGYSNGSDNGHRKSFIIGFCLHLMANPN
jgi:hypothetical protein